MKRVGRVTINSSLQLELNRTNVFSNFKFLLTNPPQSTERQNNKRWVEKKGGPFFNPYASRFSLMLLSEKRRVLAGRETSFGGHLDINLYFVFPTKRGRDPSHLNMFHRNKSTQFADTISNMG